MNLVFVIEDPLTEDVRSLLQTHLDFCHKVTPPEHSFALGVEKLRCPEIKVFTAREDEVLLGVGALKTLDPHHGELKSMHTTNVARGKGIGSEMVRHIIAYAKSLGMERVSLETGTHEPYLPARTLYKNLGFEECPAFGEYELSEFNVCMTILL